MNFALTPPDDQVRRWAEVSACRRYRYLLGREWNHRLPKVFLCGLNPSLAGTEKLDDNTSKKWTRYCRAWGFGGYLAVNLYALILTDSAKLRTDDADIVGPENDYWTTEAMLNSRMHVVCWGSKGAGKRAESVIRELRANGYEPYALQLNPKSGEPAHPLYLSERLRPRPLVELRAGREGGK